MNKLLNLRLDSAEVAKDDLQIINPSCAFDGTITSAEELATEITSQIFCGKALVILNLYNKHWVGIVVDKKDEEIKLTYMDSEQVAMPELLKTMLAKEMAAANPECNISVVEAVLEVQKYNNCGLEVIENFVSYITGNRLGQEDALIAHSMLFEDTVTLTGMENAQAYFDC